jgi:CRISPR-associated protein Cas2
MKTKEAKYMWLLVMFDLPVTTKKARTDYRQFREFLLTDGYMMLQFSVYARVCNGEERAAKHLARLNAAMPPNGSVRALTITDLQYSRMSVLLGKKSKTEAKVGSQQLIFF